jgi:hypothetical protein
VLNAIQQYNGSSTNQTLTTPIANTLTSGSGSTLQLQSNGGTTAVTIDTSQNVGVGVVPSAWTLLTTTQIKNASFSGYDRYSYVSANAFYSSGAWKYITSDTAAQYTQNVSSGGHQWSSAASGTAGNNITFTQVLNVAKGATLALEGATSATGTGIAFPATQSASSDANTLDDYEEGTWTPVLSLGTGSSTGSSGSGTYIKIGRQVSVTVYLNVGTLSGGPSINGFTGLPFNQQSANQVAVGLARENANTGYGWEMRVASNDSSVLLRRVSDNSSVAVATGDTFLGTITYFTA